MADNPIDILFEEGPVIVLNKPSGILTQAPRGIESLETELKAYLSARDGVSRDAYIGVVHRLDRPASGAIIFATERSAAKRLSKQFQQRRVAKSYWALVEGVVDPDEGTWIDNLYKIHGMARAEVVAEDHAGAKLAILHYRVIANVARGAWLEIGLETGRTHQIRVQSASRGHPIVGDSQYGASLSFGDGVSDERRSAIALHARSISFAHPVSNVNVEVVAPISAAWEKLELPAELKV